MRLKASQEQENPHEILLGPTGLSDSSQKYQEGLEKHQFSE